MTLLERPVVVSAMLLACASACTAGAVDPPAAAVPITAAEHTCGDHADEVEPPGLRDQAATTVAWRAPGSHAGDRARAVNVKLVGFNDFHGQISAGRLVTGRPVGGAQVFAAYVRSLTAGFAGRSLIVHAGDAVGATPPASALLQDEPTIAFLNLLGSGCSYAFRLSPLCNLVGTVGNHELDEGQDELMRLVYGGNHEDGPFLADPYRGAKFPYVSANIVDADSGWPVLPPFTIKIVGGLPVGIIGAVLEDTPSVVTAEGVAGLEFLDEADAINTWAQLLRAIGIETIIVTIHQGGTQTAYAGPTDPAGAVTGAIAGIVDRLDDGVDVVISGHSHQFTNAIVPNRNGVPILVTQAFSASTAVADIDLEIDRHSRDVVAKSARVITTFADVAPGTTPQPDVAALVTAAETAVAPLVSRVVGETAVAMDRIQTAAGESVLGDLIADAQRAAMDTDVAFMNPGGIRADLDAGPVTWGELFTVQPFGNTLARLDLTGAQIVRVLEQQWQPTQTRFLQISGLTYTWNSAAPIGSRVVAAQIGGVPIDPAAVYSVTANNFIATGGDGFSVFTESPIEAGGPIDLDALVEYVEALPQPITAPVGGRITRL